MLFKEITAVYLEKCMKPMDTLFEQNTELVNVKACGVYRTTVF
jgi:hypothetical protein